MGLTLSVAVKLGFASACVALVALLLVFAPRLDPDHDAPTDPTPAARVLLVMDVVADAFEQVRGMAPHGHHHRNPLTAGARLVIFASALLSTTSFLWSLTTDPARIGTNPLPVKPPPRS